MSSIALFSNNAASTLALAINSAATTAQLSSGTGALFPAITGTNYFIGTFTDAATGAQNEIVKVTGRTGDVITFVRAQEGTSARSWAAGDNFEMFWTAGEASLMVQQSQAQQQSGNYAVNTGGSDILAITLTPAPLSFSDLVGVPIRVLINANNTTTTPTLNVNGIGPVSIVLDSASPIPTGTLANGSVAEFIYNGTQFQYNGEIRRANFAEIQFGASFGGLNLPMVPYEFAAAYQGAVDSGNNGGHQYLMNGWLVQWGAVPGASSSPLSVTFTIPYPTVRPTLLTSLNHDVSHLPGNPGIVNVAALTITGFTAYTSIWNGTGFSNASGSDQSNFHWLSIGPTSF